MTSAVRASGRSTLLITRITGRLRASALRRTNRVWGSGPSAASTSSTMPSTMVSARSTSPPKSAWPGVSTMFSVMSSPLRVSRHTSEVFLARIVMPFSRSRSPESMTRSATSSLARNAPDWWSSASTRVVLPWSTCATIAMLRMSARCRSVASSASAGASRRVWSWGDTTIHAIARSRANDRRPGSAAPARNLPRSSRSARTSSQISGTGIGTP